MLFITKEVIPQFVLSLPDRKLFSNEIDGVLGAYHKSDFLKLIKQTSFKPPLFNAVNESSPMTSIKTIRTVTIFLNSLF